MAVVTVSGCPGSPGATSTALALLMTWPLEFGRQVVLAECDPDGGAVVLGALAGRSPEFGSYGMRNLGVAASQGQLGEAFWRQLVDLADGAANRLLLPGFTDPAQSVGLAYSWDRIAEFFTEIERVLPSHDVIVDLGRSGGTGPSAPLVRRADLQLLVVRNTLRGIAAAQNRARALRTDLEAHSPGADGLALVVIDEGPYGTDEVARQIGAPVAMTLPYSSQAAAVLSDGADGGRSFQRSALMRSARTGAEQVRALISQRRERLAPVRLQQEGQLHAHR
ncbi:hypothetical protein [Kitasatospora kifunensis]|uniref:Uncharacterized protein n=1 Tax=Kitasatospora kifunensis TaxID=58351 RepID=A0A7W7W0Z1_KITKI|nr:hypothetical protein [Kitasatospora kifunensis]MBB4929145.1 hypothetical protein [Kitasatospora kifunensis]